ncbi:MAG: hemerythrin domain-containing protein [Armatimonadetes bacterium]|nr:hemerythrin domain-containing protein [Armatimonadota bacterium]
MGLQIGGSLAPDFDDPLGLMRDCHRRIERFLETLVVVAQRARGGALDGVQRDALDTALRYFAGMAPKHTADEEQSLFPRLREQLGTASAAEDAAILARLDELERDHVAVGAQHDEVERLGRQWLEVGSLPAAEAARIEALLLALREAYRVHIAHEDEAVFPLAGRVLAPEQLAVVGQEMAARRGSLTCSERKRLKAAGG